MAMSAAKAGFSVTAIDAFGDRDLRAVADVIVSRSRHGSRYSPVQAAALAASVSADLVAYTSSFENYPAAVLELSNGRKLLGNPPRVLERVRNPLELSRVLRRHALPAPLSRTSAPAEAGDSSVRWLLKSRRSGGGNGVQAWRPDIPVPRGRYLQERISGTPGSLIMACNGTSAVVLGLTRQLVGEPELGARDFQYCGSLLLRCAGPAFPFQDELFRRCGDLANVVAREFELVGLNGIDFIADQNIPYLIEVNPRFSASMELVQRAQGISMFDVHFEACHGRLPLITPPTPTTYGKTIVFARRSVKVPPSRLWEAVDLADLPHPGERIEKGHPICTVFAEAQTPQRCRERLLERAAEVYRSVERRLKRAS
jgi:uncharacterized protein